jgi:protein-L-isoaspartate(D-aspartate) O-methyltransferase
MNSRLTSAAATSKTMLARTARLLALLTLGLTVEGLPALPQDSFRQERQQMVEQQIRQRGITSNQILSAMNEVPRHEFVGRLYTDRAYDDRAIPIGETQTIPQPYLAALMADLLDLGGTDRVLEIGTGSGYQAAILASLASQVYTIEILEDLAEQARATLSDLGYENVEVVVGDGYRGLPDKAPFDAILVTAAPSQIPQPLREQLRVGGRLVIPVGDYFQDLLLITRTADGFDEEIVQLVRLEKMTGEAQQQD